MYLWTPERVKVKRVIDGDTIEVELDLAFRIKQEMVLRLARIDTPEKKDRVKWQEAKDQLEKLVSENSDKIKIVTYKAGKYGRYLADIWAGEIHVNKYLLDKGLAKSYNGGKK